VAPHKLGEDTGLQWLALLIQQDGQCLKGLLLWNQHPRVFFLFGSIPFFSGILRGGNSSVIRIISFVIILS
jgi:hypothetical protein